MGISRFYDGQNDEDQSAHGVPAWPRPKPQRQLPEGYAGGAGHGPMKLGAPRPADVRFANQHAESLKEIAAIQDRIKRPSPPQPAPAPAMAAAPPPRAPSPPPAARGMGAKMPEGGPNVAPPPRPQQQLQQQLGAPKAAMASNADWMHPMQREGLDQYHAALKSANDAVAAEMESRANQAQAMDRMAHEQSMAAMRYQAEMAQQQGQAQLQQQEMARRDARNSALMKAAGVGGTRIVNGQRVDPFSSIRQSLLG